MEDCAVLCLGLEVGGELRVSGACTEGFLYQGSNPARRGVPSLLVCKAAIYTGLLGGFVRVLWGLDGWVAFFLFVAWVC